MMMYGGPVDEIGDEGSSESVHRRTRVAVAVSVLLSPLFVTAAQADDEAVTTMTSAGSPLDGMFLTYVGCDAIDGPASAPVSRINRGPVAAPLGRRSFGLVPSGTGTASGPAIHFLSLAALGASVDVRAENGTVGASHIWVSALDAPPGHAWRGRAALTVPPAHWLHVDTASLPHEWQLIDLTTGQTVAVESGTPADFAFRHGDGAGYVVTGFGCDGEPFNVDAVRGNGRVWDFEGLSLSTSIVPSATQLGAGEQFEVSGTVTDPGGRVMGDPLVLQSRLPGVEEWTDVSPLTFSGPGGASRVSVTAEQTAEFRWRRPESEYADAGASEPVLVTVAPAPPPAPAVEPPEPADTAAPVAPAETVAPATPAPPVAPQETIAPTG